MRGLGVGSDSGPGGVLLLLWAAGLERSVTAVEAAGGTVAEVIYAFPGGRRLIFLDPSGNKLGVWGA